MKGFRARCPYCQMRKARPMYDHSPGWLCCPHCGGVFPWRNKTCKRNSSVWIIPCQPSKAIRSRKGSK